MTARGNCFTAAMRLAGAMVDESALDVVELYVVHGLPVGRGPANAGARFWHAWVETLTGRGWLAVDVSNGQRVAIRRASFYRLGRLDEAHLWRYSWADALANVELLGHAGPWREDPPGEQVAR